MHSLCTLPSDLFLLGVSGLAGGNRHCSWFRVISEGCADPRGFFPSTHAVLALRECSRAALCRAPRQRPPLRLLSGAWSCVLVAPCASGAGLCLLHRRCLGSPPCTVAWMASGLCAGATGAPLVCSWVSALTPLCYPHPVSQQPPFQDIFWGGGCLRSREFSWVSRVSGPLRAFGGCWCPCQGVPLQLSEAFLVSLEPWERVAQGRAESPVFPEMPTCQFPVLAPLQGCVCLATARPFLLPSVFPCGQDGRLQEVTMAVPPAPLAGSQTGLLQTLR